jgi:hypothetical protein
MEADLMALKGDSAAVSQTETSERLFTLKVYVVDGPLPERYAGKELSRTIQIRGDQTLADLHRAIFDAFDRWEDHLYEFQFGKGPHDPDGARYAPHLMGGSRDAADVTKTTLDSLGLDDETPFGYWFDFGDDWYHQINVLEIGKVPKGRRFPKVVARVGKSPPQYMEE